jgi:CheY-like chemotaxis protein
MRLIYVDNDALSVRTLHSEFLDYRGLNWRLTHCKNVREALEKIEQDHFQCLLLRADGNIDSVAVAVNELVQSVTCPPILTVTDGLPAIDHLQLILDGSDDCLNRSETNGSGIMRRLRMAELRRTVWGQQAKDLVEFDDTTEWFATAFGEGKSDVKLLAETVGKTLRVAHVCYGRTLTNATESPNSDIEFIRYGKLEELIHALDENILSFDAILLEQSVFEEVSESALSKLKRFLLVIPAVVLTLEKSDFAALSYLERGFTDCITADRISSTVLTSALRKAVVRRRRSLLASLSEQQVGPTVSDRRMSVRASQNRRRHTRFLAERSLVAIPVLSNDAPDIAGRCEATTIDVSLGGMGVKIPDREQLPSRNWIVGMEQDGGVMRYVNAYLRRVDYRDGELHVGLIFQGDAEDMLHQRNLWPAIDPVSKRFETRLSNTILDQWTELGVLQKQLVRRASVCPECEAVCSVGTGCSQCGDFRLHFKDLIHHFACAHVNEAEKFENMGTIQCPKCLRDNLVAGADFEMIRSQYVCETCEYEGDVTAQVGCCLNCQLSFPLEMGKEVDVYGYSVERMDILALVDSVR